jgi:hypothetical protein
MLYNTFLFFVCSEWLKLTLWLRKIEPMGRWCSYGSFQRDGVVIWFSGGVGGLHSMCSSSHIKKQVKNKYIKIAYVFTNFRGWFCLAESILILHFTNRSFIFFLFLHWLLAWLQHLHGNGISMSFRLCCFCQWSIQKLFFVIGMYIHIGLAYRVGHCPFHHLYIFILTIDFFNDSLPCDSRAKIRWYRFPERGE